MPGKLPEEVAYLRWLVWKLSLTGLAQQHDCYKEWMKRTYVTSRHQPGDLHSYCYGEKTMTARVAVFPTDKVREILNISVPQHGDTFVRITTMTITQLERLVECGAADPQDCQNSAPSIEEFLDVANLVVKKCSGVQVTFTGYVVFPPRSDTRVSIEGMKAEGVDWGALRWLAKQFHRADDLDLDQDQSEKDFYSFRCWYD